MQLTDKYRTCTSNTTNVNTNSSIFEWVTGHFPTGQLSVSLSLNFHVTLTWIFDGKRGFYLERNHVQATTILVDFFSNNRFPKMSEKGLSSRQSPFPFLPNNCNLDHF